MGHASYRGTKKRGVTHRVWGTRFSAIYVTVKLTIVHFLRFMLHCYDEVDDYPMDADPPDWNAVADDGVCNHNQQCSNVTKRVL